MDQKTSETSSAAKPQKPTSNSVSSLNLAPMTRAEAAELVTLMLGSYPSLSLHDPKAYMANICTLLCGYPLWAGEDAIGAVKRSTKFIPTEAELYEELNDRTRAFRYAAEWDLDASRMIADHSQPVDIGPKLSYAELRAKYDGPNGEKWGIGNPDTISRPREKTAAQSRASLIEQFGQAAFDAVPNAAPDQTWKPV